MPLNPLCHHKCGGTLENVAELRRNLGRDVFGPQFKRLIRIRILKVTNGRVIAGSARLIGVYRRSVWLGALELAVNFTTIMRDGSGRWSWADSPACADRTALIRERIRDERSVRWRVGGLSRCAQHGFPQCNCEKPRAVSGWRQRECVAAGPDERLRRSRVIAVPT